METIRLLIADDHALFREGLRALFSSTPGIRVVAEAVTGEEVVALAASTQPDIVLMDINMPGKDGIQATRRILRASLCLDVGFVGVLLYCSHDKNRTSSTGHKPS